MIRCCRNTETTLYRVITELPSVLIILLKRYKKWIHLWFFLSNRYVWENGRGKKDCRQIKLTEKLQLCDKKVCISLMLILLQNPITKSYRV